MEIIPLELRKLGLTEKEVKVYLTSLDLGPTSVQNIAQAAGLSRPTTYEIIKKLREKGLFFESKENKKRRFIAQPPERILGILRTWKRELEEKEREFIRIIADLETKYLKGNAGVKLFKGKEGLRALEEIISFTSVPEILIINPKLCPIGIKERKKIFQTVKKRLGRVEVKEINTGLNGSLIILNKVILFFTRKLEGYLIGSE